MCVSKWLLKGSSLTPLLLIVKEKGARTGVYSPCMHCTYHKQAHLTYIHPHRSRTGTFSSSSLSSTQPLIIRQDSSVFTPGNGQQFIFPLPSPSMSTNTTSSSNEDSKQTASHPSTAVPLAHSVAPIGHDYINSKGLVFMEDVHNFALQIACGLQHLASMQVGYCGTFFRMHQIWLYRLCTVTWQPGMY